jgi:Polyketide cyclase / dehydrase and lipid transport
MQMAHVAVSKRYDLPAEEMWARIGDPGSLAKWHPGVETTEMLDSGRTRVNTVPGGGRVVEPILEQADYRYTFRITESPLPFDELVSTILVRDDGGDACVVEWDATFQPNGVSEAEATDLVRAFYQTGLDAL